MTSHEHLETRVWKPKLSEQGKGHKSDGQKQIWKIQKGAHGILENKVDGSFGIKAERSKKVEAARYPLGLATRRLLVRAVLWKCEVYKGE